MFYAEPEQPKFIEAIYQASNGNTAALCAWLASAKPLEAWQRKMLADLLKPRPRGQRGRPKGKRLPSLDAFMERGIVELIKIRAEAHCEDYGLTQTPSWFVDEAFKEAQAQYENSPKPYKLNFVRMRAMYFKKAQQNVAEK